MIVPNANFMVACSGKRAEAGPAGIFSCSVPLCLHPFQLSLQPAHLQASQALCISTVTFYQPAQVGMLVCSVAAC